MKAVAALAAGLSLAAAAALHTTEERAASGSSPSLLVDEAPQTPRPYALRKGGGRAESVGAQVYRFSVTGNASGGAFTLMQTNAPASGSLGVLPHLHKAHYENFYCTKGRVQLWVEESTGSVNSSSTNGQAARVLTTGDYGAVPPDTVHTFQMTDPDTQLTGVIHPGGFEALFLAIGDGAYASSTGAAYAPGANDSDSAGSSAAEISALEAFDVYAQLDFTPRRDLVNGTAGGDGSWHDGFNELAADASSPAFVARGYGPKYLNADGGVYRLVAPLATGAQTAGNFSMGTVTMSQSNTTTTSPRRALALQVEEGALDVSVKGYGDGESVMLLPGDVVFLPANTSLTYGAAAAATRFLYVSGGGDGFDKDLLERAVRWEYAMYPTEMGVVVQ